MQRFKINKKRNNKTNYNKGKEILGKIKSSEFQQAVEQGKRH